LGRFDARVWFGSPRTPLFFLPGEAVSPGPRVRWRGPAPQPPPPAAAGGCTVLIFGGSAGARRLNQTLPQALALAGEEVRVIHQTGKADYAEVSAAHARLGVAATVVPFIDDMQEVYPAADLVICRAGATTLAGLTTLGKPAILIPYPYAADDHQRANAEVLVEAGAAHMILDAELTPERAGQAIRALVTDRQQLAAMARAAAAPGRPDAPAAGVRGCRAALP